MRDEEQVKKEKKKVKEPFSLEPPFLLKCFFSS